MLQGLVKQGFELFYNPIPVQIIPQKNHKTIIFLRMMTDFFLA